MIKTILKIWKMILKYLLLLLLFMSKKILKRMFKESTISLILEKQNFLQMKKNNKNNFSKPKFLKLLYFLKYQNYWLLNKNNSPNLQTKIFTQFITLQHKDRFMSIIHINHHQLKIFQTHSLKHKEIYILHLIDLLKYH